MVDAKKKLSPETWASWSDAEILKLRFRQLGLTPQTSELAPRLEQFFRELEAKNLKFRPRVFLGDEWFSPEGMNAISVPFFLAHPRLKALEKSVMLDVEGGDSQAFLRLIRHEAGHCFDHCYRFSKRRKWRSIFGSPEEDYHPETYRPQPFSRSFVKNLPHWYAQAHPEEDFAETFAVWLDPERDWKKEFATWPQALRKLQYVDELAQESAHLKIRAEGGEVPSNVDRLTTTLEKYYQRRRREHADEYPDFYDSDLRKIFNGAPGLSKKDYSAARFMQRQRKAIVATVAWATSERKFTIDSLVRRLTDRCDRLELRVGNTEPQTLMEVASLLTSLVKNYLFTGKFKRKV
ncbi:MAG: putative zinc-binding metallopeptidase [Bdellovibrionales bacterium]|nr:putative zinc-binding metallopeptidase [Bdellovibrionales bacterium]